jgi:hypothetical protein
LTGGLSRAARDVRADRAQRTTASITEPHVGASLAEAT